MSEGETTTNVTAAHADQVKAVAKLQKLVERRGEMLDKAKAELAKVEYKVSRRTEILEEHEVLLAEAQDVLAGFERQIAEASSAS